MEEPGLQVDRRLAVCEEEEAYFVIMADDPDDWLMCFKKSANFPVHE